MASQNDYQLALRIPSELLNAIDAEVERVKAERPGARVQRSDVVREALMRAFFSHPQTSGIIKRDSGEAHGNGRDHANGGERDRDDSPESH
ncbi:MAG TPA: hypothetical protein VGL86_12920 [Polyangia bacterium]|jgi:Arc/MetJ-type ribon-helix-helix transcriptional regulator